MRRFLLLLIAFLMVLFLMRQLALQGGSDTAELPRLRIVCEASADRVRCPSECELDGDNVAHCRCEDVYQRSNDDQMRFSHAECE